MKKVFSLETAVDKKDQISHFEKNFFKRNKKFYLSKRIYVLKY